MHKTIVEHMLDILIENGFSSVCYGDIMELDECAKRSNHTNLITLHPLVRHQRILDALDKSGLFTKRFIKDNGHWVRCFKVK